MTSTMIFAIVMTTVSAVVVFGGVAYVAYHEYKASKW
jgi:uncharacterized membrane protein YebE (DUF533 family)